MTKKQSQEKTARGFKNCNMNGETFLFCFQWDCSLNSGPCTCKAGTVPRKSWLQPFFALAIWGLRSHILPRLAWTIALLFTLPSELGCQAGTTMPIVLLVEMGFHKHFAQPGL
jgi:hypothetical protein